VLMHGALVHARQMDALRRAESMSCMCVLSQLL